MASTESVTKKHCLLYNEVISTEAYDDVKKALNKLKDLSERWAKVAEIFCCNNPYKEFRYAHSYTEGTIIIIPVSFLKIYPLRFSLK